MIREIQDDGEPLGGAAEQAEPADRTEQADQAPESQSSATERLERRRRVAVVSSAVALVVAVGFVVVAVVIAEHRSTPMAGTDTAATLVTYQGSHQQQVPALDLPRLGGNGRVRVDGLGHRVLVLNFFASWCNACQSELKAVAEVANAETGKVPFFGVDTNETSDRQALRLLAKADAHYPVGLGSMTQANEMYVPGLPTTLFVNARGRVVARVFGAVTRPELSKWVNELAAGATLTQAS